MNSINVCLRQACAIGLGQTVVVTGGEAASSPVHSSRRVTEYGTAGWLRDLPSLTQARRSHACSSYTRQDGVRVLLVTGGTSFCKNKNYKKCGPSRYIEIKIH